jgi:site-specific DNA-methyltransferase (adenine-specific)
LELCIEKSSNEGDLVFDGCLGSGSTAIAAINKNRRFIGIEKDKEYFKIAMQRLNKGEPS